MAYSWRDIDWDDDRPSARSMRRSCAALTFSPMRLQAPGLIAWVEALDGVMRNGGAFAATFLIGGDDDVVAWFFTRNRQDEFGFFPAFLRSEAVRSVLPDGRRDERLIDAAEFNEVPPLELAGRLGTTLAWGGAYESFPGRLKDAKELADLVVNDLFGENYERYRIDETSDAWAPWFRGIAWDTTLTAIDLDEHRITLIAATDQD